MATKEHLPVAVGIKFVRKANMWVFFKSFNVKKVSDVHEFFMTEDEAKARLLKEESGE